MKGVPCHRTTGHGEMCSENYLCGHCFTKLDLAIMLAAVTQYTTDILNGPIAKFVKWPGGKCQSPLLKEAEEMLIKLEMTQADIDLHERMENRG